MIHQTLCQIILAIFLDQTITVQSTLASMITLTVLASLTTLTIKNINAESTLITLPCFTIFYKNKVVCVV